MKLSQVAVQLYTLREHLKTPAEMAATLKKVRAIGYTAVQESGLGPIGAPEWLAMLKAEGLTLCATHENSKLIVEDPQAAIARLKERGVTLTAYPYPHAGFQSRPELEALCGQLNAAGKAFREAGCVLTYHNHAAELVRVDGKTALDWIYDLTDPASLQGEIDTYWIQAGGGDPVAWCRKLKGRLPMLHMKDYGIGADGGPYFAEIGHGNLDFKAICAAAEASGCRWFIVEQDDCPGDPFDSLKKSFDYIKANLVTEA